MHDSNGLQQKNSKRVTIIACYRKQQTYDSNGLLRLDREQSMSVFHRLQHDRQLLLPPLL